MTAFGDDEPEDAWDRGDTVEEQVTNLVYRALLLEAGWHVPSGDDATILDALADVVDRARRHRLTHRERIRTDLLDEDIAFVRARL